MPRVSETEDSSSTAANTSDTQVTPKGGGRSPPPPSGKDGEEKKLLPPPPIYGPDGKELPRPKDAAGRPLPIYIKSDGKPVLGKDGLPIPLRFDENGKPIPLNPDARRKSSGKGDSEEDKKGPVVVVQKDKKKSQVSDCVIWVGGVDIAVALLVGSYYAYAAITNANDDSNNQDLKTRLAVVAALLFVGASFGVLPIFAVKKSNASFVWWWAILVALLFIITVGVGYSIVDKAAVSLGYLGCRMVIALCIVCATLDMSDRDNRGYYTASAGASRNYVRSGGGGMVSPQTVIVQQPAYAPAYGYSPYGYGGYYGPSYGDAALMGFAAGSLLGHHHHYGYDDWGWGGGWGGGWGYDDGWGGGWGYDDGYW